MKAISAFVHRWGCNVYIVCWCCQEFCVPATKRVVRCPKCGRSRHMFQVLQETKFRAEQSPDRDLFSVPPPTK